MQFREAAMGGDLDTVTTLLSTGLDVDCKDEVCIVLPCMS